MSYYSNPTENAAVGTVDRELKRLQKLARQIRRRNRQGLLTEQELAAARRQFVGIYRRFLVEALED